MITSTAAPIWLVVGVGDAAELAGLPVQYDMPLGVAESMRYFSQGGLKLFRFYGGLTGKGLRREGGVRTRGQSRGSLPLRGSGLISLVLPGWHNMPSQPEYVVLFLWLVGSPMILHLCHELGFVRLDVYV